MRYSNQGGNVLMVLAATMVVGAALGSVIFSMNTSSSYNEVDFSNSNKALYLAESCIRIGEDICPVALSSTTYTLKNNSGSFRLSIADDTIECIGIANQTKRYRTEECPELTSLCSVDGLVSLWSFDDSSDPGKDSYGSNDGTLGSPPAEPLWVSDGKAGGAMKFDRQKFEEDFILVSDSDDLRITGEITLTAWVKETASGTYSKVISRRYDYYFYFLGVDNGRPYGGIGLDNDNYEVTSKSIIMPSDEWHHLAFSYNDANDKMYLYYDGVRKETVSTSVGLPAQANVDLSIGADYQGTSNFFRGYIDELALFNRELAECEIKEIYHCSIHHIPYDPTAYYPFNGNADDISCQENNGTAVNSPSLAADRFGDTDSAYRFNQNCTDGVCSYIHVPDDDTLDLSTEGTLATWIYIYNFNGFAGVIHKGDKANFSDEAYTLQFCRDSSAVCGDGGLKKLRLSLFETSGNEFALNSFTEFETNKWYHVAATWDSSGMKIYIDGVLDKSNTDAVSVRNTSGGVNIGAQLTEKYNDTWKNFPFDGIIDDVLIYSRALCEDEIKAMADDRP